MAEALLSGVPYDLDPVGLTYGAVGVPVNFPDPSRRPRWQFIARPARGGNALALTQARGRKFTARLKDPSDVGFNINGRHPQSWEIQNLITDIHVLFTPTDRKGNTLPTKRVFRGRVGDSDDDIGEESHDISVPAVDYRGVLDQRRLYSWNTLDYSGMDQADIAWALVQQIQGNRGGDYGISNGTTPTGVVRDGQLYETKDSAGERIKGLADSIQGFDWDVLPVSDSGLRLETYYPERGSNKGLVLIYGGEFISRVKRTVNVTEYRNAFIQTGADGTTETVREAEDLEDRPEGRWDGAYGNTALTTQEQVEARADWQLNESQVIQPSYTLTWRNRSWLGPDQVWLGDYVRLVVKSGNRRIDDVLRVYEMSFSISDEGDETLEMTIGGPPPDPAGKALRTDRRLLRLETH